MMRRNSLPAWGLLSTSMRAPIDCAARRAMARPSPVLVLSRRSPGPWPRPPGRAGRRFSPDRGELCRFQARVGGYGQVPSVNAEGHMRGVGCGPESAGCFGAELVEVDLLPAGAFGEVELLRRRTSSSSRCSRSDSSATMPAASARSSAVCTLPSTRATAKPKIALMGVAISWPRSVRKRFCSECPFSPMLGCRDM